MGIVPERTTDSLSETVKLKDSITRASVNEVEHVGIRNLDPAQSLLFGRKEVLVLNLIIDYNVPNHVARENRSNELRVTGNRKVHNSATGQAMDNLRLLSHHSAILGKLKPGREVGGRMVPERR
jgi:hypothetical protein